MTPPDVVIAGAPSAAIPSTSDASSTNAGGSPATPGGTAKAKSQYYYWHGHEKDRAAVGDVAPKAAPTLLKCDATAPDARAPPRRVGITTYSWCNNDKTVSVYVDVPGVQADRTTVDFAVRRLTVTVRPPPPPPGDGAAAAAPEVHQVLDMWLSKDIKPDQSSFRVKPGTQIVIKLVKEKDTMTWIDLSALAPKAED